MDKSKAEKCDKSNSSNRGNSGQRKKSMARQIIEEMQAKSFKTVKKYNESYAHELVKHMQAGFSFSSFASVVGATPSTIKQWRAIHEDFDEAAQLGEAKSLAFWERELIDQARGIHKGQSKLVELVMKCRFLWSEKQHIELTGALETQLRQMTDQQIEMELRKLQARQNDLLAASGEVNTDEQIAAALEKLK